MGGDEVATLVEVEIDPTARQAGHGGEVKHQVRVGDQGNEVVPPEVGGVEVVVRVGQNHRLVVGLHCRRVVRDERVDPDDGVVTGTVARIVTLGFEVRIDIETPDGETWVQLTRGEADRLDLSPGTRVGVRAVHKPTTEIPADATVEPSLDTLGG